MSKLLIDVLFIVIGFYLIFLFYKKPEIGLVILLILKPIFTYLISFWLGDLSVKAIMVNFTVGIGILLHILIKRKMYNILNPIFFLTFALSVWLFFGLLYTPSISFKYGMYKSLSFFGDSLLLVILALTFNRDFKKVRSFFYWFALSGWIFIILFFIAILSKSNIPEITRFRFYYFAPIALSKKISICIFGCFVLKEINTHKSKKILNIILWIEILLGILIMLFTGSKGPFVGLIISLFIFLYYKEEKKNIRRYFLLIMRSMILISFVFSLFILIPEGVQGRLLSLNDSINPRIEFVNLSIKEIPTHIIQGGGTGSFSKSGFSSYPHNIFMEILVENGLIGLTIFIIFLVIIYLTITKELKFFNKVLLQSKYSVKNVRIYVVASISLFLLLFIDSQFSGDLAYNSDLWFAGSFLFVVYNTLKQLKFKSERP